MYRSLCIVKCFRSRKSFRKWLLLLGIYREDLFCGQPLFIIHVYISLLAKGHSFPLSIHTLVSADGVHNVGGKGILMVSIPALAMGGQNPSQTESPKKILFNMNLCIYYKKYFNGLRPSCIDGVTKSLSDRIPQQNFTELELPCTSTWYQQWWRDQISFYYNFCRNKPQYISQITYISYQTCLIKLTNLARSRCLEDTKFNLTVRKIKYLSSRIANYCLNEWNLVHILELKIFHFMFVREDSS